MTLRNSATHMNKKKGEKKKEVKKEQKTKKRRSRRITEEASWKHAGNSAETNKQKQEDRVALAERRWRRGGDGVVVANGDDGVVEV